jgi:riboflavin kinase/FMN adenylyltransferase
VHFLKKLREEQRFSSLDALKAQIARDAGHARTWFTDNPILP